MNSRPILTNLPDIIRIDDVSSGKISADLINEELERLKVEVNILRNDLSLFLQALATIPENRSQQDYYKILMYRLKAVQNGIKEYSAEYNRLLPIVNLSQIKLGHELEQSASDEFQDQKTAKLSPAKIPVKKNGVPEKQVYKSPSGKDFKNGSSPNQPILL